MANSSLDSVRKDLQILSVRYSADLAAQCAALALELSSKLYVEDRKPRFQYRQKAESTSSKATWYILKHEFAKHEA